MTNSIDTRRYIDAVLGAIENGTTTVCRALAPLRNYCPECDSQVITGDEDHTMIGPWVIIGCEGYWAIDPNWLGIDKPNWSDWRFPII